MPPIASDPRYVKSPSKARDVAETVYLWVLRALLRQRPGAPRPQQAFQSILVIRHNMLGDAVVSSVLIQALKGLYPQARISVLASDYNKEAFAWIPGVDEILVWPKRFAAQRAFVASQKGRFDLVFQTLFDENYINRMLVARSLATGGVLVGRARRSPMQQLMDHAVELPVGSYAAKLLALLQPLSGLTPEALVQAHPQYKLNLPDHLKAAALRSLQQAGVKQPFILLNISARVSFRAMGDEQVAQTAQALTAAGHQVVISCVPAELGRAHALIERLPQVRVCQHDSLGSAMAAVAHASLYVGPDTGTVHFAAAFGVPSVVLFATIGRPDIWSPYGTAFISLQASEGQNVADIPARTIVSSALELLDPRTSVVQRIQLETPLFFALAQNGSPVPENTAAAQLKEKVPSKT